QDALKSTRAIHAPVETPAQIEESFDLIAYQKGGAVIQMLEGYVGKEAFRRGMNAYLERYAYGNASTADFTAAMSAAAGRTVDEVRTSFVTQPGLPLVEAERTCAGGRPQVALRVRRFFLDPPALARSQAVSTWHVPICYKTAAGSGAACQVVD